MKKMQLIKKFNNNKNKNNIFKYFKMNMCLFIIIINFKKIEYILKRVCNIILINFQRNIKKKYIVFH